MARYWWMLITVPLLAWLILQGSRLLGRKQGARVSRGTGVWIASVILGLVIVATCLLDSSFRNLLNILTGLVFAVGGLIRLWIETRPSRKA